MTDGTVLLDKAGVVVMALSALASVLNHIIRAKQTAGESVAGWLLQVNAVLNVGALNLDKAVQQFKAAKAAGATSGLVKTVLSLIKGKAPALEAVLEKAAEVEAKAEETPVTSITAGEPLMAVSEPITLVKEEAAEEKVELTAREPELEQKVTQEDVAASAAAGVVDFVHNEEEQLPPPPAEIVVPELAEDTIAYVTETPKKRRSKKPVVEVEETVPSKRKTKKA